jgi:ribosomal protein L12E/L44/L45/RPP1/RPP2
MVPMHEMIQAVRDHANAHYEEGWDVIVEAWEDKEIEEVILKCRTKEGAIKKIGQYASIYRERQADARYHAEMAG